MSFSKITNTELNNVGATTLPNQPTISATALKQKFDEPAKNLIAPKFNNLVDELGATSAATNLGAVSPPNRAAATPVQGVMNNISSDLDSAQGDIANLQVTEHTHTNKALLDTYTQTEADLAQAVADDHTHSNKALLDTYTQTEADIAQAIADDHTHSNKTVLDKLSDSGGNLEYDGQSIGAVKNAFKYVKVGAKTLTASGGEDTYELVEGSNVTLVANETTKTVTITATGGGGGGGGDMYKSEFATNGSTGVVDEAVTLSNLTATVLELNTLDGITANVGELNVLDGITASTSQLNWTAKVQETTPADGDLLTYDYATSKWINKAPDKSFARYAGAKTFAQLTSALLIADNVDKFYLCTDGGTITSPDDANWVLPEGSVIPADSHIAVIEDPDTPGAYLFDDFGGYVDISGKADKTELDSYTELVTQANGKAVFDNLNPNYGYEIEWDDSSASGDLSIPKWTNVKKESGTNAGTIKYTYTISGGTDGTSKFALRIKK